MNRWLANAKQISLLPPSWGTLYEMTRLDLTDAERAIHEANPPKPEGGDKRSAAYKNTVVQDNGVSPQLIRDIRAVHSKVTDA